MNRLLAIACSSMAVIGVVLVVASILAARAQGGWQLEAEEPDRFVMPLEWVAVGGASMMLVAPLLYFAGRADNPGRNF